MKIPLSIVMDRLAPFKPESHITDKKPSFSVVNIFPSRARALSSSHLYVGRLSEIFDADWRGEDIYCVAVRDRFRDEEESPERMKNIIVLNSNCDPLDVFTAIQRCFFQIIEWNEQMKDYIITNHSLQDILRLSEDVIGNYITISDSALGLMAYTAGLSVDCPVTNALIENGYHNEESMALFKKHRLPEDWAKRREIYINDSRTISPYPNICKVVRYNNCYFAHVIMVCNVHEPSDGLVDLFQMMLDHLMVCFERQWNDEGSTIHVYDNLISTLVEEELPEDILEERAANCGLPMNANFLLLKISPQSNTSVIMQRMGQDIMSHLPEAKVTVIKDTLVALIVNRKNGWTPETEAILEQQMERYSAQCGISNPFTSLTELNFANKQADIALKYGVKQITLPFSGNAKLSSPRLHSYEAHYPYYLMCGTPEFARLAEATNASVALRKLEEYDRKHGSNNLELLYVYLNNDRKATETAAIMHMHRNNVIYRVNRICDIIDIDLSDSSVRFRLLLAYELFTPRTSGNKN